MKIKDKSIEFFLEELASKAATPGGGSVAAMMGAQSAALISMVCRLTIGKDDYANVETDMKDLLKKSVELHKKLTAMIQADVDVFNRIMACYRLPKLTNQEKEQRSVKIQQVLKEATMVPLDCVHACVEAIKLARVAANKGSLTVVSDAGVAVISAYAGIKSSALNVYINTNSIKDQVFVKEKLLELDALLEGISVETDEIYQIVKEKL